MELGSSSGSAAFKVCEAFVGCARFISFIVITCAKCLPERAWYLRPFGIRVIFKKSLKEDMRRHLSVLKC